ncbi:MAG: hypothetical protein N2490_08540 [Ignavibacteria bacterium]|nr:hypothetical protein [Ignavibacteria bacterium]
MIDFSDKYYKIPVSLIQIRGNGSIDYINEISTNDLKNLQPNFEKISLLLNESGRVIDILYIFFTPIPETTLLIKITEDNTEKVKKFLEKNLRSKNISISLKPETYYKIFFFTKNSYSICKELGISPPIADKFVYSEDLIAFNDDLYNCFSIIVSEKKIHKINSLLNKYIELNLNEFDYYRIINLIPAYPNEINETLEPQACNLEKYTYYTEEYELDEDNNNFRQLQEMHCFISSEEIKPQDLVYLQENNINGFISSVALVDNLYYCLAIINNFNIKLRNKYHTKINNEKNFLKLKI